MIGKYLKERRSWLMLLAGLQVLLLSVTYLDSSIKLMPILYIILLNVLVSAAFISVRYYKETRFYRSLEAWDQGEGTRVFNDTDAASPFGEIVKEAIIGQTESYRRQSSANFQLLEQEKDDLLAWIHEVKTPLTAMHLMIGRLPDDTLRNQLLYEWLRVHLLLDQQLHQKRIPFMANDLYMERLPLASLVNKEIRELRSWCIPKGIGFEMSLEAEHVLTDGKWLGFMLRQMLTNAVKYSAPSTDIRISSFEHDGHVRLVIEDRGRGIEAKDLPRIFDKGFTSTNSRQDGAATGMGLYLTRQAARSLRITIEVASVPGEGSAFTLAFPRENELVRIAGM